MDDVVTEIATKLDDGSTRPTKLLPYVDGVYRTDPRSSTFLGRMFPSLGFYARFAWIVLRASHQAKRGKYGYREWANSSVEVLRALEKVGVDCEVSGIEHLREVDGPCVICANHMSTLETTVLPGIVQAVRDVTFVVKRGLVEYPVFKHVMRSRDPIVLGQKKPREDLKNVLEGGIERLGNGISIIVFPQGIRAAKFDAEKYNTIGVKLAQRANVPIVPIALRTDAWAIGKYVMEIGKIDPSRPVRFAIGEPLHIEGRGGAQQAAMIEFIGEKLRQWESEA
jgi:1-acyl-sn-glycerol-3-phosphate acyltransferase